MDAFTHSLKRLTFVLLFSAALFAQPNLEARLAELREESGFPGITAGVVMADGKLLTAAAGGLKPTDRMLAGSTGKTFCAAVILKAVDEQKLDLDSKIEKWIGKTPGFTRLPNAKDLTLRLLLSHRSGINDYVFDKDFAAAMANDPDKVWSAGELVSYMFDKPALSPAGTQFAYADANFVLAGFVFETVTGKKLFSEVERLVIKPLTLTNTVTSESRVMTGLIAGRLNPRTPFHLDGSTIRDGKLVLNAQSEYAGGGMISTAGDLARWASALWQGKVFSKAMLEEVLDGKLTGEGRGGGKDAKYGLAVQIQPSEYGVTYAHAGWFPGYQTEMMYFPEHKAAIAIQVNQDPGLGTKKSPRYILMELAKLVLKP